MRSAPRWSGACGVAPFRSGRCAVWAAAKCVSTGCRIVPSRIDKYRKSNRDTNRPFRLSGHRAMSRSVHTGIKADRSRSSLPVRTGLLERERLDRTGEGEARGVEPSTLEHHFGRVRVHETLAPVMQPKLKMGTPGDKVRAGGGSGHEPRDAVARQSSCESVKADGSGSEGRTSSEFRR